MLLVPEYIYTQLTSVHPAGFYLFYPHALNFLTKILVCNLFGDIYSRTTSHQPNDHTLNK